MTTTTRKTTKTTTKAATNTLTRYSGQAMRKRAERLRERAADEGHGPRWVNNRLSKRRQELDTIEAAGDIESIDISVEWKKSSTWGANPTATASICTTGGGFNRYQGTASGCGYDKESAAVAEALNQCPAVQRLLIVASKGGKLKRSEGFPYGATANEFRAGFDSGVGVSCFRAIFEASGFVWECVGSGKTFDAYTVRRKGAR